MRFRKGKAKRKRLEQAEQADYAVRGCFDVMFSTALRMVSVGFFFFLFFSLTFQLRLLHW